MGKAPKERGVGWSDAAEHVIVGAHVVVVHEQVASEGFIVEIAREVAHRSFNVPALLDDVSGEVLLAVPFAAVCFLEVVEFVGKLHVIVYGIDIVLYNRPR